MEKSARVALAEMVSHGKERLVLIRSAKGGLVLQVMFYADEVRDFDQVPKADNERLSTQELELSRGLIEKLSSEDFEPEIYRDEYRERVLALLDEKAKGRQITAAPKRPAAGHVIDLMAALKESMRTAQRRRKITEEGKRKKA